MTNGTLALVDVLFQEAYICASVGGAAAMAKTPITADVHQALDIQLYFCTKLTFYLILIFNELTDGFCLIVRPILWALIRIYITARENFNGAGTTNAEYGGHSDFAPLFDVKILSCNSWHRSNDNARNQAESLSLTLFVFRVLLVDHVNAAFATNNFVVGAAFFDTGTHFHVDLGS
jgi:hypothetical protein